MILRSVTLLQISIGATGTPGSKCRCTSSPAIARGRAHWGRGVRGADRGAAGAGQRAEALHARRCQRPRRGSLSGQLRDRVEGAQWVGRGKGLSVQSAAAAQSGLGCATGSRAQVHCPGQLWDRAQGARQGLASMVTRTEKTGQVAQLLPPTGGSHGSVAEWLCSLVGQHYGVTSAWAAFHRQCPGFP